MIKLNNDSMDEASYLASMAQKFDEGMEKGKTEIAQALLIKQYPLNTIVDITGLSLDKVIQIRDKKV